MDTVRLQKLIDACDSKESTALYLLEEWNYEPQVRTFYWLHPSSLIVSNHFPWQTSLFSPCLNDWDRHVLTSWLARFNVRIINVLHNSFLAKFIPFITWFTLSMQGNGSSEILRESRKGHQNLVLRAFYLSRLPLKLEVTIQTLFKVIVFTIIG